MLPYGVAARKKTPTKKPVITRNTPVEDEAIRKARRSARLTAVRDALQNSMTGIGTARSKLVGATYERNPLLTPDQIETLLQDNDLACTIVYKIIDDALRDGFTLERKNANPSEDAEIASQIMEAAKKVDLLERMHRGAAWGRAFGGGGLILGVKGAGALSTELNPERSKGLDILYDFDLQDMTVMSRYRDGSPEMYRWSPRRDGDVTPKDIHASRVMVFPGAMTTNRGRQLNKWWDHSVLQRVYAVLLSFDQMWGSVDHMFADASQSVFKMQGLIQGLAEADGDGENDVMTRLSVMDMSRSTAKAIVLEAGLDGKNAEDFQVIERKTLSDLDGMVQQYYVRLAAAAKMPLTVLLGMSPAGMNATGESDMALWYNTVDIYRKQVLAPRLLKLVRLIAAGLGVADPEDWEIVWPELARPKPLDVKTAEKMAIDAVAALITNQVILPEEAALALRRIAPTLGITIDVDARIEALVAGLEELRARELGKPAATVDPNTGETTGAPAAKASGRKTPSKAQGQQAP